MSGWPSEFERADRRLAHGGSACASSGSSASNADAIADARERRRGRDGDGAAAAEHARASAGAARRSPRRPSAHDGRQLRLGVAGAELLDQHDRRRRRPADDRLDDLAAHRRLPEQPRQGVLDRRAAQPAEHGDDGAQVVVPHVGTASRTRCAPAAPMTAWNAPAISAPPP